jgi:heat shock protein HtpX
VKTRYARDRGLSARMGLTLFVLGLLYVVAMAVLIWFGFPAVFVVGIAIVVLWGQWYYSDRIALYAMRAQDVTPEQAPDLHAVIDRLCAMADMPKPRVTIAQSDVPNAFATGRSPQNSAVCVTTGLLRRLNRDEVEAVLSHELSHIAHRDVTVMAVASFVGVLAGVMTRSFLWGGMYRRSGNQNTAFALLAVLVVSVIVYITSFLLIRALGRYRELAADRAGALLTGRPSHLASALQRISGDMGQIPTEDLRRAEPVNAFFFAPALAGGVSLASLLSTHPSLDRRLENLAKVAAELGQA